MYFQATQLKDVLNKKISQLNSEYILSYNIS